MTGSPYGYAGNNPLNFTDPLGLLTLKGFLKGAALGLGAAALVIGTAGIAAPSLTVLGIGAATLSTGLGAASTVASIGVAAIDCNRRWDLNCVGDIAEAAGGAVATAFGIPAITQGRTALRFMFNVFGFVFDAAAFVEVDPCKPTVGQRLSRGGRL